MGVAVASFLAGDRVRTLFCLTHPMGLNSPSQGWMTGSLGPLSSITGPASALATSWDSTVEIASLAFGDQIALRDDSW